MMDLTQLLGENPAIRTATAMFGEMDMQYWLERAEAEMRKMASAGIRVVALLAAFGLSSCPV